jgi:hypothetical protein
VARPDIKPLCPKHHGALVSLAELERDEPRGAELGESDVYTCPIEECGHRFSLTLGHFVVIRNDDYWRTTRPASIRMVRHDTQVICGKHKRCMYIADRKARDSSGDSWLLNHDDS